MLKIFSFLFLILGSIFSIDPSHCQEKQTSAEADQAKSTSAQNLPPRTYEDGLNRHSLGVGIGQAFLTGDFKNNGNNSISWDAFYDYSASYSFDFLANFHYSVHSNNNNKVYLPSLSTAVKAKFFQFDSFSPYALAGLGFYAPKIKTEQYESEGKIVFGVNLGIGLELKLNENFKFGSLFHFHNPFDSKQELGPEVEGSYARMLLTSMYTF